VILGYQTLRSSSSKPSPVCSLDSEVDVLAKGPSGMSTRNNPVTSRFLREHPPCPVQLRPRRRYARWLTCAPRAIQASIIRVGSPHIHSQHHHAQSDPPGLFNRSHRHVISSSYTHRFAGTNPPRDPRNDSGVESTSPVQLEQHFRASRAASRSLSSIRAPGTPAVPW